MDEQVVRCPYCVLGDNFRMLPRPGWFTPEVWPHGDPRETRVQMLLSEVWGVDPGSLIKMPTHEQHILRILGDATEPLFSSEIKDRLNRELGAGSPYTMTEIVKRLQAMEDVAQLRDGRWTPKG